MARTNARLYHHGNLRAAVIDAALAQITAGGVGSVSLRAAAKAIGVSHNAPYRHFADKQALLAAIATDGFRALAASVRTALQALHRQPLEALHASGRAYLAFAIEHPAHYRVMFGGAIPDHSQHPELSRAISDTSALMRQALEHCQQRGLLRAGDLMPIELTMRSAMHGLATLAIDGELDTSPTNRELTELAEAVMTTVDRGILTHPQPR